MRIIINISLARSGNTNIGPATALRELQSSGFRVISSNVQHSDTEQTVVALCEVDDGRIQVNIATALYFVSALLGQDCVAYAAEDNSFCSLAGPNAAAWGQFNPEFFLLLDGSRLIDALHTDLAAGA